MNKLAYNLKSGERLCGGRCPEAASFRQQPTADGSTCMIVDTIEAHFTISGTSGAIGFPPRVARLEKGIFSWMRLSKYVGRVERNNLKKPRSTFSPSGSRNCHGEEPPSPYPIVNRERGGRAASTCVVILPAPAPNAGVYQSTEESP